jgi:hypothetical protein
MTDPRAEGFHRGGSSSLPGGPLRPARTRPSA